MRLSLKLIVAFFLVAFFTGMSSLVTIYLGREVLRQSTVDNALSVANHTINEVELRIQQRVNELQKVAQSLCLGKCSVHDDLAKVNSEYISKIDAEWKKGADLPLIDKILKSPLSRQLADLKQLMLKQYGYPVFTEIFAVNREGVVYAASNRTSDYLQSDEQWYREGMKKSDYWVGSDVVYDVSSKFFTIALVLKLYDGEGKDCGLLKASLNIEDVNNVIKDHLKDLNISSISPIIVDKKGHLLLNRLSEEMENAGKNITLDQFGQDVSDQKAVALALKIDKGYLFSEKNGKEVLSIFSSSGKEKGLQWSVILNVMARDIFAPIDKLERMSWSVSIVAFVIAIAIAIVITKNLTDPINHLTQASAEVREGNLSIRTDINSKDEIGKLANAFNEMTQELQQTLVSKDYFEKIIDSIMGCLIVMGPDGIIERVNQGILNMLGFTEDELLGKSINVLIYVGEDTFLDSDIFSRLVSSGAVNNVELKFVNKYTSYTPVLLSGSVMYDDNADPVSIVCSAINISEYNKVMKDYAKSQQSLNNAQRIAHVGNWEWNIVNNKLYWSDEIYRIFGFKPQEFAGNYDVFLNCVHPDDREILKSKVENALTGEPYSVDHRIIWPNGIIRHVHEEGEVIHDETGKPVQMNGIVQDITERKKADEKIRALAQSDALTGLPNRIVFHDHLEMALARSRRFKGKFAVLFLDLDHFKDVNDTLGHPVGDQLLVEVGKRLKNSLRSTDTVVHIDEPGMLANANHNTVARLGGDEFAILLTDLRDERDSAMLAERIIKSLAEPFHIDEHEIHIGGSVGIAVHEEGTDCADVDLMAQADMALYQAKQEGRGRYYFHDRNMAQKVQDRVTITEGLHRALENEELVLHFQPQVDADTERIIGFEALVRWQHPERGLVGPGEFIGVAEDTGLIVPIGNWILREACTQLKKWQEQGLADGMKMAVNISAIQFKHIELNSYVDSVLFETGLDPECLELELTEGILMESPDTVASIMNELSGKGVKFSIDDFGTGYSSLQYLKQLPVYKLKIAQEFVRDLVTNANDSTIVSSVIGLARELGMRVIAEGVETEEQFVFLQMHGCHEIQGYLFSKPKCKEDLLDLLKEGKGKVAVAV